MYGIYEVATNGLGEEMILEAGRADTLEEAVELCRSWAEKGGFPYAYANVYSGKLYFSDGTRVQG